MRSGTLRDSIPDGFLDGGTLSCALLARDLAYGCEGLRPDQAVRAAGTWHALTGAAGVVLSVDALIASVPVFTSDLAGWPPAWIVACQVPAGRGLRPLLPVMTTDLSRLTRSIHRPASPGPAGWVAAASGARRSSVDDVAGPTRWRSYDRCGRPCRTVRRLRRSIEPAGSSPPRGGHPRTRSIALRLLAGQRPRRRCWRFVRCIESALASTGSRVTARQTIVTDLGDPAVASSSMSTDGRTVSSAATCCLAALAVARACAARRLCTAGFLRRATGLRATRALIGRGRCADAGMCSAHITDDFPPLPIGR